MIKLVAARKQLKFGKYFSLSAHGHHIKIHHKYLLCIIALVNPTDSVQAEDLEVDNFPILIYVSCLTQVLKI